MSVRDRFIRDNRQINILSNRGEPYTVPSVWRPLLGEYDALVAIPDMHMFFHGSPQDCFQYGAPAMKDFLEHLIDVKQDMKSQGRRLAVVQLGDMYELRYPHPLTARRLTPEAVIASHPLYETIHNQLLRLETVFIIGNHDYELARSPERVVSANFGRVFCEHGYQADRWYHFSNPQRKFWETSMYLYSHFRRWEARVNKVRRLARNLSEGQQAALGILSGAQERSNPGDAIMYSRHRLKYYDRKFHIDLRRGAPTRIIVTAHSHVPLLYTHACNDHCWYVDAGAWTEGRSDFVIITNDEIALCRYKRASVRVTVPILAPLRASSAALVG